MQDAGRGQGGFAMEFIYPMMLVEAASSFNFSSSPIDAFISVRILRISQMSRASESLYWGSGRAEWAHSALHSGVAEA